MVFPQALSQSVDIYRDRVGYKLENLAKKRAPAITGNLRRQIFYSRSIGSGGEASVFGYAAYAKYVHGAPFYKNRYRRKETPFLTLAVRDARSFIKDEQKALLKRVVE